MHSHLDAAAVVSDALTATDVMLPFKGSMV
jgi:hypothetical protein